MSRRTSHTPRRLLIEVLSWSCAVLQLRVRLLGLVVSLLIGSHVASYQVRSTWTGDVFVHASLSFNVVVLSSGTSHGRVA